MKKINFKLKAKFRDKRKTIRLNIPLSIEYKLLPRKRILKQCFLENISGGGLMFTLEHCLNKGDRLKTLIYFPEEPKPVAAFSKVVWCKKISGKDKRNFNVGIKYIKLDPKDKERFVFLFCELMINYFIFRELRIQYSDKHG